MAKITVQAISRKAKQIRKPGEKWTVAIKRASRMLKSGTVGARKSGQKARPGRKSVPKKKGYKPRKPVHQTGTSSKKIDKRIRAKQPGKRRSASGKTYYEYRRNRSDMPGQLTGTSGRKVDGTAYREMILRRMKDNNNNMGVALQAIEVLKSKKAATTNKLQKKVYQSEIDRQKKFVTALKKDNSMLKALFK